VRGPEELRIIADSPAADKLQNDPASNEFRSH